MFDAITFEEMGTAVYREMGNIPPMEDFTGDRLARKLAELRATIDDMRRQGLLAFEHDTVESALRNRGSVGHDITPAADDAQLDPVLSAANDLPRAAAHLGDDPRGR